LFLFRQSLLPSPADRRYPTIWNDQADDNDDTDDVIMGITSKYGCHRPVVRRERPVATKLYPVREAWLGRQSGCGQPEVFAVRSRALPHRWYSPVSLHSPPTARNVVDCGPLFRPLELARSSPPAFWTPPLHGRPGQYPVSIGSPVPSRKQQPLPDHPQCLQAIGPDSKHLSWTLDRPFRKQPPLPNLRRCLPDVKYPPGIQDSAWQTGGTVPLRRRRRMLPHVPTDHPQRHLFESAQRSQVHSSHLHPKPIFVVSQRYESDTDSISI